MEYKRIVAVTGLPGLFELLSSKTDGAIVRSLEDRTSRFVSSRIHNLSHLESIEVYTTGENVNLVDVFHAMKENGDALPDTKDNMVLRNYFENVYPTIDFERVYASDLKKMVKWYEVLEKNDIEIKLTEEAEEIEDAEKVEVGEKDVDAEEEEIKKPSPKAKPKAKKTEKEEPKKTAAKPKAAAKKTAVKKAAPKKSSGKKKEE